MEHEIQFRISKDQKLTNYLKEHSEWYKYLNRNSINYRRFLNDYKKELVRNHIVQMKKKPL